MIALAVVAAVCGWWVAIMSLLGERGERRERRRLERALEQERDENRQLYEHIAHLQRRARSVAS